MTTLEDILDQATTRLEDADLCYGHGTYGAFDEAAFIVLESLGLPTDELEPHLQRKLSTSEMKTIEEVVTQRIKTRKPVAYLLKKAYIQGVPFYIDERAIVPRSYIGELLFSDLFTGNSFSLVKDPSSIKTVLDLCTGSGCLAILGAHLFPNAQIDAVDLSADALEVAKINVQKHNMDNRVTLYQGSLFEPVKNKTYDLIITNPPYVTQTAIDSFPPEYQHEPTLAHSGGDDGMDLVRQIIDQASLHLNPSAGLLCEIGMGKPTIEANYPHLPFLWLDTAESSGEVFWLTKKQL